MTRSSGFVVARSQKSLNAQGPLKVRQHLKRFTRLTRWWGLGRKPDTHQRPS